MSGRDVEDKQRPNRQHGSPEIIESSLQRGHHAILFHTWGLISSFSFITLSPLLLFSAIPDFLNLPMFGCSDSEVN